MTLCIYYRCRLKRKRALLGRNPPRDKPTEAHPNDGTGVAVFDHCACVADYSNFGIYDCSGYFSVPYNEPGALEFYTLLTAYPNPFNSTTTLRYGLPYRSDVSLQVYDLSGQRITTLFEGNRQAGVDTVVLKTNDLPSGLYFIRLEASGEVAVQKVRLIRQMDVKRIYQVNV